MRLLADWAVDRIVDIVASCVFVVAMIVIVASILLPQSDDNDKPPQDF